MEMDKNITHSIVVNGNVEAIYEPLRKSLLKEGFAELSLTWPTNMEFSRGKDGLFVTSIKDCKTLLKVSLKPLSDKVELLFDYNIELLGLFTDKHREDIQTELLKIKQSMACISGHKIRVLAVDDSADILEVVKDYLTEYNYDVETADNGAQALDKYLKFRPDVVTLDLTMPIMDGYETLQKIFKMDKNANVILITALESKELIKRCLEKGALSYISKPFSMDQLLITIESALNMEKEHDKNVTALFSYVTDKFESIIKKMLDSDASIILKDVKVIKQETPMKAFTDSGEFSKIANVPKTIEPLQINVPEGTVCYLNEITGHQNGMILTLLKSTDLHILVDDPEHEATGGKAMEFFSTLHLKILSELANSTHLILNTEPLRLYDKNKDKAPSKEVAIADFEITTEDWTIPLQFQIWFNI